MIRFLLPLIALASPASACRLALMLAVDVSGSVNPQEFATQMNGLAEALRDPIVSEALVRSEAAVALMQWTGTRRQAQSLPWTRVATFEDLDALAQAIEGTPRRWRNYSTAIGEALLFGAHAFEDVPDCSRRVIDISGDGRSNEGVAPLQVVDRVAAADITVNALVIVGTESDLPAYFRNNVIIGPNAFVEVAGNYAEFPLRMRLKLLREVAEPLSMLMRP